MVEQLQINQKKDPSNEPLIDEERAVVIQFRRLSKKDKDFYKNKNLDYPILN